MKLSKIFALLLALCLISSAACAATFTDAHGNVIELDDSLEAYAAVTLVGADNAARQGETNLGDLWADALRWFAVSGEINAAFDEDDVKAGNDRIAVDADHVVALWNGGNLRADIAEGTFGAEALAEVLPFPNKVAVVYMTGAQLLETLETFVLDAGMNSGKTSEFMGIHTNTVQYRLKKINEILGAEITGNRVIPGLTIALALRRMESASK